MRGYRRTWQRERLRKWGNGAARPGCSREPLCGFAASCSRVSLNNLLRHKNTAGRPVQDALPAITADRLFLTDF